MACATSAISSSVCGRNSCSGGVEQADGHRQAAHDLEQLDEIGPLHRQELGERSSARLLVFHLTHDADAVRVEEHVLGAAEPDALGAEPDGGERVGGRLGIGAHLELAHGIGPLHQRPELASAGARRHSSLQLACCWPKVFLPTSQSRCAAPTIPQGSPISPLLANLYMRRFVLGRKILGLERSLGSRIVTYVDDLVILCRRGKAAEALQRLREIMGRGAIHT